MSFSLISSSTSGVRSLPVKPVPPVVIMTSTSLLEHQSSKIFLITCLSSLTISLCVKPCPFSLIFFASIAPDVSVASVLVSEMVKTDMLIALNIFWLLIGI